MRPESFGVKTIGGLVLALAVLAGAPMASAQEAGAQEAGAPPVRVRYIVRDVQESVEFYSRLGFKVDAQSGAFFAALSRGGVQLLLSPVTGPGGASQPMPNGDRPAPGGWNRIVLDTPDLKADVDRLRSEGVRFRSEIITGLGGNQILLDDPSGNVVELFQPTLIYTPQ